MQTRLVTLIFHSKEWLYYSKKSIPLSLLTKGYSFKCKILGQTYSLLIKLNFMAYQREIKACFNCSLFEGKTKNFSNLIPIS